MAKINTCIVCGRESDLHKITCDSKNLICPTCFDELKYIELSGAPFNIVNEPFHFGERPLSELERFMENYSSLTNQQSSSLPVN